MTEVKNEDIKLRSVGPNVFLTGQDEESAYLKKQNNLAIEQNQLRTPKTRAPPLTDRDH